MFYVFDNILTYIGVLYKTFQPLLECCFSVVDFAEDKLKLFGASFDWNSKSLMSRLCNLFLGMQQGQAARPQTAPQGKVFSRPPVSLALKLKLVPVLMKSVVAANMFPNSVNVRTVGLR